MATTTNRSRTRVAIALSVVTLAITACSLIVDTKTDQCTSNADCAGFAATVCQSGVCVLASSVDGATDSPTGDGPSANDGGDADCVPKIPATQDDFLNESCTGAQCFPFDDCARLGWCEAGAALPALIPCDGGC